MNLFIIIGLFIILFAIFWPREKPLVSAGLSAHLGNLGAKFQVEAMNENFETFDVNGYQGKTFALFYAPWCPHCKNMMPEWDKLSNMNNNDIKIVKVNCDENPDLAKMHNVESFPTIYFLPFGLNNPKNKIEYKGDRKGEAFLAFIANK
jgi:protein disulfide-isomerase-like protein